MQPLAPPDQQIILPPVNQTAPHWAHQLFGLFPSLTATTLTFEFIKGVESVLELYPDKVLAVVCNPAYGIASKVDFFPSLAKLKAFCEEASTEILQRERRAATAKKAAPSSPKKDDMAGCYTGPIEEVKPGGVLHYTRFEEYREFMRTKKNIPNTKLWGFNETWKDTGQRPFQLPDKPEPNPFD